MKRARAFTLVEMMVVIAIIAIVAAMVAGMSHLANVKKRITQVEAEKQKLIVMIGNYQSKLNYYPPDNGNLVNASTILPSGSPLYYDGLAATNPLIYELTGATNLASGNIQFFDGTSNTSSATYQTLFNRAAVNNASTDEPHDFFKPGPKLNEYTNFVGFPGLAGLLVPVGVTNHALSDGTQPANFWHYDSSSTNRHNASSYDLWAEFISDTKGGQLVITTNGNW